MLNKVVRLHGKRYFGLVFVAKPYLNFQNMGDYFQYIEFQKRIAMRIVYVCIYFGGV